MNRLFRIIVLLCAMAVNTGVNAQQKVASVRLASICAHYQEDQYWLNPLSATQRGIYDYNDQLEVFIGAAYQKQGKRLSLRYLDSLARINRKDLNEQDALTADILVFLLKRTLSGIELGITGSCQSERPVDQFVFSFPTLFATQASGTGFVPFHTVKQYEDFIQRMKLFNGWVDVAIANMNQGIRHGNTNPRAAMLKVPDQLKPLFEGSPEQSLFYKPITQIPDSFNTADSQRLAIAYHDAIRDYVQPAYKKLNDYIVTTYIPACRTTSGLRDNANGKKEYAWWVNYWTTAPMDPDSIFNFGLQEVRRIRTEMDSVKKVTGFDGELPAFFNYVTTDPKFFPFKTTDEVLDRFRSFHAKMEPRLKELFNLVPRSRFEVRATEKFRQAGANAQYMRPSLDGSRPGIFYEVIPDAVKYNYIGMETLFLHEAIPGHHFQIALQQELDLPEFRKSAFFGAFSEGWGLYAETLGDSLGMYKDPYQYLGRLNADMERSVRLVVDVGLHVKGWSREKAIDYILENQPLTRIVAEQRIERYMVIPGQALSYKAGEQKILFLRKLARQELGAAFDIREFHDEILKDGAMPLSILDAKIRRWIARKKAGE